jgi:hypothetical protein
MSRVVEGNGAQVLPDVKDPQATVSAWSAHLAADADMRVKFGSYALLALSLKVEAS